MVSGDYKRAADPTCCGLRVVRCDTFVTESTFGLPIYRWDPTEAVIDEVMTWWRGNAAAGDIGHLLLLARQSAAPPRRAGARDRHHACSSTA